MFWHGGQSFTMFSTSHFVTSLVICCAIIAVKFYCSRLKFENKQSKMIERILALSLLGTESLYYIWMGMMGKWHISHSLPLELCSISLYIAILLLWTNNYRFYPFVFFAGIGGAVQAIMTPDLELGFPHFRFFHFFYTHGGIILTAFYFTWKTDHRPTFKELIQTILVLNVIAVIVYIINLIVQGNYMFLRMKPENGSLLDYLGDYPYYILSMEFVAFITFLCLWLLFRRRK